MDHIAHNQPAESQLLKRARHLDAETLTWIYQEFHDPIYRYIYHHLGQPQTAQDLTSDVFRRFLQALRTGGGPNRKLGAWLYRVAHNLIVDELRRQKHRDHDSLDGMLGDGLKADGESLEDLVGKTEVAERTRLALLTLTEEQRQVVVLKFLQGMSNAEVAEVTGKTVGAVKALQHRGLDILRAQLAAPQTQAHSPVAGDLGSVPSLGQ